MSEITTTTIPIGWIYTAFGSLSAVIGALWILHVKNHGENKTELTDLRGKYTNIYGQVKELEGDKEGYRRAMKDATVVLTSKMDKAIPDAMERTLPTLIKKSVKEAIGD